MATRMWDPTTEGEVWLVDSGLEVKNHEADCMSAYDTDSTMDTMTTIESIDLPTFFRIEYGRSFSAFEGVPMVLPTDDDEIHRLRTQHLVVKLVTGEMIDEIMSAHLSVNSDGVKKRVLDVRTQTGLWAEEVATRFPEVDVKSVDVAPTVPHMPRPNLHHEVYDVHEGILEADATFDIVHARHSLCMVKDWHSLLKDMHRVLRPGGLFIFGELYPQLTLPEERIPAVGGPASRTAQLFEEFRAILTNRGVLIEGSQSVDGWLSPQDTIWESSRASGFHDIVHKVWELPANGLWHPDPFMQEIGLLMAMNICQFAESTRPLFLSSGLTNPEFDEWLTEIQKEMRDPMNNAVMRYHLVCAYKI
ncbi:hypothetical protein FRC07_000763 [Ceratobasidium sp. 392]|nr:hypothetical protein FRC07_000763 [Ceratobasidium sp. 392]